MNDALEAGADDFINAGEVFEVDTDPAQVSEISGKLSDAGYAILSAETEMIPSTYVSLDEESIIKMNKLLEQLEDNDDVLNVWHNWE
jgi:transcriptional/translational regulatory protein YebC/TACO1